MDKKIIQKAGKYFTETEKHLIIQELISSGCTKAEICEIQICTSQIRISLCTRREKRQTRKTS